MTKKMLVLFCAVLVFSIMLVGADSSDYLELGNPFKELWDAILDLQSNLQQKITEIWNAVTDLQDTSVNLQEQIDDLKKKCPEDMVEINNYCIDKEVNKPALWEEQVKICGDEGKRICLVSEWNYACQLKNPEIINIGKLIEWGEAYRFNYYLPSCEMNAMGGRSEPKYARCCKDL